MEEKQKETKKSKKSTQAQEKSTFDVLYAVNVNEHVEKKKELSYLSWAYAWAEVKKCYPNANYEIKKFGENNLPYIFDENTGYMVFTSVTIDGVTHDMWLPVMDSANKAMKSKPYTYDTKFKKGLAVEAATMFDINKSIMRCLVKNLAMFGLGLYIYAGEDLPEEDKEEEKANQLFQERKNLLKHAIKKYCNESGQAIKDVSITLEKHIGKSLSDINYEDTLQLIKIVDNISKGGEINESSATKIS